jgi:hypothetical protein
MNETRLYMLTSGGENFEFILSVFPPIISKAFTWQCNSFYILNGISIDFCLPAYCHDDDSNIVSLDGICLGFHSDIRLCIDSKSGRKMTCSSKVANSSNRKEKWIFWTTGSFKWLYERRTLLSEREIIGYSH